MVNANGPARQIAASSPTRRVVGLDSVLSARTNMLSQIAQIDSDISKLQALDSTPGQVV